MRELAAMIFCFDLRELSRGDVDLDAGQPNRLPIVIAHGLTLAEHPPQRSVCADDSKLGFECRTLLDRRRHDATDGGQIVRVYEAREPLGRADTIGVLDTENLAGLARPL